MWFVCGRPRKARHPPSRHPPSLWPLRVYKVWSPATSSMVFPHILPAYSALRCFCPTLSSFLPPCLWTCCWSIFHAFTQFTPYFGSLLKRHTFRRYLKYCPMTPTLCTDPDLSFTPPSLSHYITHTHIHTHVFVDYLSLSFRRPFPSWYQLHFSCRGQCLEHSRHSI